MNTTKAKIEARPEKPSKAFARLAKEAEAKEKENANASQYLTAGHWRAVAYAYRGAASIARSYGV